MGDIMVTDYAQNSVTNSNPSVCLTENQFSDLELRLMLFWAKHPHAKLSLYSITNAVDNARIDLRNAISSLVGKGILKDQYNSDLTTYSLTDDQMTQDFMDQLCNMRLNQLKILAKQLEGGATVGQ